MRRLAYLLAVAATLTAACGGGGQGAQVHEFVIPEGTYERAAAGEDVGVIPAELEVEVGDRIRIVNEDGVGQTIGPYYVGPQSTLEQEFKTAGVLEGMCTAHPDGSIRIVVKDP